MALLNCSAEKRTTPSERPRSVMSSRLARSGEFLLDVEGAYLFNSSTKMIIFLGIGLELRRSSCSKSPWIFFGGRHFANQFSFAHFSHSLLFEITSELTDKHQITLEC